MRTINDAGLTLVKMWEGIEDGDPTTVVRFVSFIDVSHESNCWLWTGCRTAKGYGRFSLNGRGVRAHRVAFAMNSGRLVLPTGHVLHRCDNPPCVNPSHLFEGTPKINTADMIERGRFVPPPHQTGSNHHNAKFGLEQHMSIQQDRRPAHVIAAEFGVSTKTVYRHRRGETWRLT